MTLGAGTDGPQLRSTRRTVRATQARARGTRGRPPRAGQRPSTATPGRRQASSGAVLLRYAGIAVGAVVVMAVLQRLAQY